MRLLAGRRPRQLSALLLLSAVFVASEGRTRAAGPVGPVLSYSSYLGGTGTDSANAVAVDAGGFLYVAGTTSSANFPVTAGSFQSAFAGGTDAFVAKFDPSGRTRIWATYLGGRGADSATGIAVDGTGNVFVTGETDSADFPTTAGAFRRTYAGGPADAFVAKLNASGAALVYATYLGGSGQDRGGAIAVDAAGSAYVTGRTDSADFPTTPGAFQSSFRGGAFDAFVSKLSPSGDALVYATYVGGADNDSGFGIAVDAVGSASLTGGTKSADFPTTLGAYRSSNLSTDAFVLTLDASGTGVLYGTFLGGSFVDRGNAIALDATGALWVTGQTSSTDFPTAGGPVQGTYGGGPWDAFVTRVDPSASGTASVPYSSFLGGSGDDRGLAIAVTAAGVLLAGQTASANFPRVGAPQAVFGGGASDAFVAWLSTSGKPLLFSTYLGGSGADAVAGAAFHGPDEFVAAGRTDSRDFPLADPAQGVPGGGGDAFLVRYGPTGPGPTPTPTPGPPALPAAIPSLSTATLGLLAALVVLVGLGVLRGR